jgi:CBS-domain-containing membrane protein
MKTDIGACAPDDELVTVLLLMRDRRCGWTPVIDRRGVVVGVITDRDAAMAMLNHPGRSASKLTARDAMTVDVIGCASRDGVRRVLGKMALHHVRRLPVLDSRGHLSGVVSIDDIVCERRKRGMPQAAVVLEALRAIITRPTAADAARVAPIRARAQVRSNGADAARDSDVRPATDDVPLDFTRDTMSANRRAQSQR